ncbi:MULTISPECIES: zinc-binding alcohol dehydrogenase family protein [Brenneria]|uniref:Zinc-type alcohol dehydrogenase-like protein n=1 Tax=Brenneria nigrifluens DSM 30175 = ATCC 13028 TaxID=1121120 RepID=A0A2U1UV48_9GAMM|nr:MULTISPECIES: zinc-binding alcohol dehydrogenase family protein [Brenneria]EHD20041.1 zinc-binding alcohol dehydrogenase family protein [Brenneria sp. EniD312]PWC25554.1 zinc-binding alcohol dehydrogenase family protein [Brenneria nigrifluens DSM 30175 = ATCC 13028]QCR03280.1 zinc-binding alcohol dehydrogenase family protein [Brenneria nigrifluens DSM 30175 = ATCC 13028]
MTAHAIAVDPRQPENFITITQEIPEPGEYDLLVEVKAVSVNPVDTKVHAGLRQNGLQQPRILGWDASGVVVKTGNAVGNFRVGDEVWYAGDITRPGSNSTHQLIDARIAAHKPVSLDWPAAAALPLTSLTAWEGLFEHLKIQQADEEKTLLIIGGAGGVGSLAISLAALRSPVKIIATASRPDSAEWCRQRGAHLVVDYRHLVDGLEKEGIKQVDYIFCLNDTDGHWDAISKLIAPLGHICTIVENQHPLDQNALKLKSAVLHWEFMFTRSMFNTPDISRQGEILQEVAHLIDTGKLQGTASETLQGLSVETLRQAHRKVLEGHMRGKVVIAF